MKKKSPLGMHRGRGQMQQHDQDNGRELGLAGYAIWKSDTKSVIWVSLNMGIHSDLFSMSSYSNEITLYKSLHICWWSILESTIWEILYLGSLLIITRVETNCVFLEKELDIADLSMDIWKTRWTKCIDSGRQRVNNSILG